MSIMHVILPCFDCRSYERHSIKYALRYIEAHAYPVGENFKTDPGENLQSDFCYLCGSSLSQVRKVTYETATAAGSRNNDRRRIMLRLENGSRAQRNDARSYLGCHQLR
jgi:hypothetical protein